MKNLILLALLIVSNIAYSQTESIEKQNISARFQNGDFSTEEYRKYAQDWFKLLKEYGGYPKLPYDSVSHRIIFKYTQNTGFPKKVTYDRIMEWAAINFGALTAVLHYENLATGKIILKGNFDVTHLAEYKNFWGDSKEKMTKTTCKQTYIFTIKDDKLKIEIVNLTYEFTFSGYFYLGNYIPETTIEISIHTLYPITNFDSSKWKEKLDILHQTDITINSLVNNLNHYIKNYNDDYVF